MTVRAPEFEVLPSLQFLDAAALSRASKAKIDVGFFQAPCCERYVRAVIERGIVVGLEMSPCKEANLTFALRREFPASTALNPFGCNTDSRKTAE